jgi:hypothetical protein
MDSSLILTITGPGMSPSFMRGAPDGIRVIAPPTYAERVRAKYRHNPAWTAPQGFLHEVRTEPVAGSDGVSLRISAFSKILRT